jgi:hypothetical protein
MTIDEKAPWPPHCDLCQEDIKEAGSLLFGPPTANGYVRKFHICIACFEKIMRDIVEVR